MCFNNHTIYSSECIIWIIKWLIILMHRVIIRRVSYSCAIRWNVDSVHLIMGSKLERKVRQIKAVPMWYSQTKRKNFQFKSLVEKTIRITTASPLVANESLQLRAANCKTQFNRRSRFAILGPESSTCRCTNCYTKPWRWYQKSFGFVVKFIINILPV